MRPQFVLRLIDLTLLLLLSLLAVVRLTDYDVELPHSYDLEDEGTIPLPLQAVVNTEGSIFITGDGTPIPVSAEELAQVSLASGLLVELRVDQATEATRLLDIHAVLQAAEVPATFLVEFRGNGDR